MKKQLLIGLIVTLAAGSAVAGVKEKKAMRHADTIVTAQLAKTMLICESPNLTVDMGWDGFKAMIETNKEALAKKRYKTKDLLIDVGNRTESVLQALAKICTADADYKEEIGSLTAIVVTPKPTIDEYRSSFTIENTVINVSTGYYMTRKADDYIDPIKALF